MYKEGLSVHNGQVVRVYTVDWVCMRIFFFWCVNILKFYLFSMYVLMQLTVERMMECWEDKEAKSIYT